MEKLLAKLGMWLHKHNAFVNVSTNPKRIVMDCQACDSYWSYDR